MPREAPPPGHVELEVHAAGLNFKDLMVAMGMLPRRRWLSDTPDRGSGSNVPAESSPLARG